MKYIRTEDGIFENEFVHVKLYGNGRCSMEYKDILYPAPLEVKQADTIEELCDQFVFVDDFYLHEHRVCHSFENAVALSKKHNVDIKTFMGAIWTKWGLKYVAKMSDKGELVLI